MRSIVTSSRTRWSSADFGEDAGCWWRAAALCVVFEARGLCMVFVMCALFEARGLNVVCAAFARELLATS